MIEKDSFEQEDMDGFMDHLFEMEKDRRLEESIKDD